MSKERAKFLSSIYLIIENDEGKILLQRRQGTKLWPGYLALPAGHIDEGENDPYAASIREAREELGIIITEEQLQEPFVVCRRNKSLPPYFDVYFKVTGFEGQIEIKEPEKCSELVWAAPNNLPEDVIDFEKEAMIKHQEGIDFSKTYADNEKVLVKKTKE